MLVSFMDMIWLSRVLPIVLGHCRSLCTFAASLLLVPIPVVITIFIPNVSGLMERVEKEIAKGLNIFKTTEGSEVRVISLPAVENDMGFSEETFSATWHKLQLLKPLECNKSKRTFPPYSKPAGAVFDVCLYTSNAH
jgi:hypothetical protein